ncbi:MAG: 4-hydroxy-tetrahydrodipicolinate synthase [Rickettsiaceae bacterium]|nr:4-hydroxy-tetrahydrodipicolinate synthase [Rickettsiaceae bacterium]
MQKFFDGIYTALITPFKRSPKNNDLYEIDYSSLETLIHRQIDAKVSGIIIAGSTGEASSLSTDEYKDLIRTSLEIARSKTKVIAGISTNIPYKALELASIAESNGVDGLMVITPYYNKPNQTGLFKYFEYVHNNTNTPIMLYTVPSRTGVDFSDDTILVLSSFSRILGLKDSGNDLLRPLRLMSQMPSNFALLSGEDSSFLAYYAHGGRGCVSVASNIIPKVSVRIYEYLTRGDFLAALNTQSELLKFYDSLFATTNPIPVKFAAHLLGLCDNLTRPPLYEIEDDRVKKQITEALEYVRKKNYCC